MPIYEYDCNHCNQTLEAIQKVNEEPLEKCPRCGEKSLKKRTSLTSFQLKGSGWYRDGYGGSSHEPTSDKKPASQPSDTGQQPSSKSPAA